MAPHPRSCQTPYQVGKDRHDKNNKYVYLLGAKDRHDKQNNEGAKQNTDDLGHGLTNIWCDSSSSVKYLWIVQMFVIKY